MVVVSRFRATWGIEPGPQLSEWKKKFVEWKAHGYGSYSALLELQRMGLTIVKDGIELDIASLSDDDLQLLRRNCDEAGLEINVMSVYHYSTLALQSIDNDAACSQPGRVMLVAVLPASHQTTMLSSSGHSFDAPQS